MERDNNSYFERAVYGLKDAFIRYRVPYFTALAMGFLAYMFAFTNKLLIHDEITCLFGKGMDVSSGRWGLALISLIFPDYSMPWLYGAVSLLMVSAAICLMLDLLRIKSVVIQAVLSAVIVTFPAQMDTFCYMFASSAYAAAMLLAVLSAWIFAKGKKGRWVAGPLMLAFSIGIYQAYLAFPASLFILLLIERYLDGDDTAELFREGLRCLAMLAVSAALYYIIMLVSLKISGESLNGYATSGLGANGILSGLVQAYAIFPRLLLRGYFGYITPGLSRVLHCICVIITAVELAAAFFAVNGRKRRALLVLLIVLFPLSISFIYLVSNTVHTLVLYGFVSVYLLFGVLADGRIGKRRRIEKDILLASMTLIMLSNVTFANSVHLKQYLEYENAFSFYTSLLTQIRMDDDYDPALALAIVGEADATIYKTDSIPDHYITGMYPTLVNVYSRMDFLRFYVGYDVKYANRQERLDISLTEEYSAMPSYPDAGCIARIGDYLVVKLG